MNNLERLWEDISLIYEAKITKDILSVDNSFHFNTRDYRYNLYIEYRLSRMWDDMEIVDGPSIFLKYADHSDWPIKLTADQESYSDADEELRSEIMKDIYEHILPLIREAKLRKIGL